MSTTTPIKIEQNAYRGNVRSVEVHETRLVICVTAGQSQVVAPALADFALLPERNHNKILNEYATNASS